MVDHPWRDQAIAIQEFHSCANLLRTREVDILVNVVGHPKRRQIRADKPERAGPSNMHAIQKLIDCGKHLVNTTLLHQIDRCLVLQQPLAGEQP